MTDERRRRDEQRLLRAQEIAHTMRTRQAELCLELQERALLARSAPVQLAAYRRSGVGFAAVRPDDVS